jgi:membrane protease YdiL (CAAX protease family)
MKKILGDRIHLDWKITTLTVVSTLVLLVDYYHYPILPWTKLLSWWDTTGLSMKILDRTLLYFFIPMFIILVVFRENPKIYGFSLGDWKAGMIITIGAIGLMTPILWLVSHGNGSMQSYYKPLLAGLPWNTLLDLFGWEFIFRGWLLFGYARKFGEDGIWLQAVPFALAHVGKPELETLSTIFGGFAFGWVAWRTKSFVYPLLIHWFIASITIIIAAGLFV